VIEPFASGTPVVAGDSISRDVLEDVSTVPWCPAYTPFEMARRI
jgi:hypothetical protein